MSRHRWEPRCDRPTELVHPVRIDPSGVAGPTPNQARWGRWRRCAPGWYVPADTPEDVVEQRIVEQAGRLPNSGAVTAWAALRWRGANFFDGMSHGGRVRLPIPVLVGGVGNLRNHPGSEVHREQFAPYEREVVDGLPCAMLTRALFDEMRRTGKLRDAVVACDMASAAQLTSVDEMREYAARRSSWTGVPLVRKALLLSTDDSRSPMESRMRLVWVLDAGLPTPQCNKPIFDLRGNLLGVPDLLDPVAGVVGEYDGADHTELDRRRGDASREQLFRDHGLEYFELVTGDLNDRDLAVRRMRSTRSRARFLPPDQRRWTLEQPDWWLLRAAS